MKKKFKIPKNHVAAYDESLLLLYSIKELINKYALARLFKATPSGILRRVI